MRPKIAICDRTLINPAVPIPAEAPPVQGSRPPWWPGRPASRRPGPGSCPRAWAAAARRAPLPLDGTPPAGRCRRRGGAWGLRVRRCRRRHVHRGEESATPADDHPTAAAVAHRPDEGGALEAVGCAAGSMTGAGRAAERGLPEGGPWTGSERRPTARERADTGPRPGRDEARAGVAASRRDAHVCPPPCGVGAGTQVIPREDPGRQRRAALDARTAPAVVRSARCAASAVTGGEDTVQRCRASSEAGADRGGVAGLTTPEDLRRDAPERADLPRRDQGALAPPREVAARGGRRMRGGRPLGWLDTPRRQAVAAWQRPGRVHPAREGTRGAVAGLRGPDQIDELERQYGGVEAPGASCQDVQSQISLEASSWKAGRQDVGCAHGAES
jgi:hypothetical protein